MGTHVINERAIRVEAKPKALKRRDSAKTDGQIILVEDEVAVFSSPRVASVTWLTPIFGGDSRSCRDLAPPAKPCVDPRRAQRQAPAKLRNLPRKVVIVVFVVALDPTASATGARAPRGSHRRCSLVIAARALGESRVGPAAPARQLEMRQVTAASGGDRAHGGRPPRGEAGRAAAPGSAPVPVAD